MRLKSLVIASRQSDLARLQAYTVKEALLRLYPSLQIHFNFRESLGDKNLSDPLWKIPQKGVFTEDFFQDLIQGKCDIVVHSWKDLATEEKKETFVGATLPRADERDLLLLKKTHFQKVKGSKNIVILTSSPRRVFHLPKFCREFLPWPIENCRFESVRGNIATRIRKLFEKDSVDGLVMAKAALDRLLFTEHSEMASTKSFLKESLAQMLWTVIPIHISPAAPAQGALALEIRRDRDDLIQLLKPLNHHATYFEALEERKVLSDYGGGCHQKIGVSTKRLFRGDLSIASGEHANQIFYRRKFSPRKILDIHFSPRDCLCVTSEEVFFSKPLDYSIPENIEAVEVSKIPANLEPLKTFGGILWTSGLETWKKLAQQGIWVHGSQESLGENSLARPRGDSGAALRWVKLTHKTKIDYLKTWGSKDILRDPFNDTTSAHLEDLSNLNLSPPAVTSGGYFLRALQFGSSRARVACDI